MIDRHGLGVAARAGGATLVAGAVASTVSPSFVVPITTACAAAVIAFELSRLASRLFRSLHFLELDVSQQQALLALNDRLATRRPLPSMTGYAIAPDFALVLVDLIRDERPHVVLETGSGVSTVVIAYCLEQLGRGSVIALEHDPVYAARTRAELARHGLTAFGKVVDAPLEPLTIDGTEYRWHAARALDELAVIDLVIDDGPPLHLGRWLRYASLPTLAPKLAPRAVFVMNVIQAEEQAVLARWQRELPAFHQELFASKKGHAILRRRV